MNRNQQKISRFKTIKLTTIGIIGGGFSGTMIAIHLIRKSRESCNIFIINKSDSFNKGIAYNPYSELQVLNVLTSKMSAFPDEPNHFLDWVMKRIEFRDKDKTLIANSFLPRHLYGEYLTDIWTEAVELASSKKINLEIIDSHIKALDIDERIVKLTLDNEKIIEVEKCVIATGNHLPGNVKIKNTSFYDSKKYFRNPWLKESVINIDSNLPILIIGNGLTMVDTIHGLIENGFKGEIYSVSPHGFNILPHRHNGLKYSKLTEELSENITLIDLIKLINKHIKSVKEYGVSAEPVIDSLRPYTQQIWKNFSNKEKELFVSRLQHLWNMARHRIPLHTYSKIQQLQTDGKLHIISGKIIDFIESHNYVSVEFFDKKANCVKTIETSRIINCTGPETDLLNLENNFLTDCLMKGIITQDKLKLGIRTNSETFEVLNAKGEPHPNLFTLGSNLKGELWESTAVNELRGQTEKLAERLLL